MIGLRRQDPVHAEQKNNNHVSQNNNNHVSQQIVQKITTIHKLDLYGLIDWYIDFVYYY